MNIINAKVIFNLLNLAIPRYMEPRRRKNLKGDEIGVNSARYRIPVTNRIK